MILASKLTNQSQDHDRPSAGQDGAEVRHDEVLEGALALREDVAMQVVHAQQHVLAARRVDPRPPPR